MRQIVGPKAILFIVLVFIVVTEKGSNAGITCCTESFFCQCPPTYGERKAELQTQMADLIERRNNPGFWDKFPYALAGGLNRESDYDAAIGRVQEKLRANEYGFRAKRHINGGYKRND